MPCTERGAKPQFRWGWLALWGVAVVVALAVRPLLPIDETRYLSVAWEMWRRGDWLVPYLNGHPYPDKPPLLFWGMLSGWQIFGVNEWWPRLLSPLFALASVFLLLRLTRRLSPADDSAENVPFLSGALWVTYSTLVLFDTLLTACVLLALLGLVEAWRGRPGRGWPAYAAGLGLGTLTKGPVVLVHVLPVALLAPWWAIGSRPPSWRRWYLGLAAALALGLSVGLTWALASTASEGPAWREALTHQVTGRIAASFAHQRPWWWYLPLLPLILLPWTLWPPLWRSVARVLKGQPEAPVRFTLAWVVPGFVILSLLSGKQVHYLIPLLPGFALLAGLAHARQPVGTSRQLSLLSLVAPALLIAAQLAAIGPIMRPYDLRPVARFLAEAEREGRPLAHEGPYSGQFHFLGRLERPFDELEPAELLAWAARHPTGLVIRYERFEADTSGALLVRPYRDRVIEIREARSFRVQRP